MYHGDDETTETMHIYVVREAASQPSLLPVFLSVFALASLVALGVLVPYQQPVARITLRVPAVPLDTRTFTAAIKVVPTGVHVYPATTAHGTLTFSNGSVIGLSIPQRFTLGGAATDRAVYVPPATADGLGMSTVPAHLLTPGINMSALSISEVIGSSLFVRNLSPFTGGRPAYAIKFATPQDKQTALLRARTILLSKTIGLHYPCSEKVGDTGGIRQINRDKIAGIMRGLLVSWRCQYVTYRLPALYHVTGIRIIGKNLILNVWFVERPVHIWVK
jgi:hypothetical protein